MALFARFDWLLLLEISLAIHCFATGAKMASLFETFSEDEIWAINEAFDNQYQESEELLLVSIYW